eukprot:scaffold166592_cov55-Attheya_sp.AAC.5
MDRDERREWNGAEICGIADSGPQVGPHFVHDVQNLHMSNQKSEPQLSEAFCITVSTKSILFGKEGRSNDQHLKFEIRTFMDTCYP